MKISILFIISHLFVCCKGDYYETLNVSKTASTQEIRKSFKRLAVTMHPDKNKDDPKAHERFVELTKAYEILKDEEKRKHYDFFGEESKSKPKYHSYSYYKEQFGIYDDDPEIITLSHTEFEANVDGSDMEWFINFYSPFCSHCHDVAPTWRRLAKELQGAVMFGAVNCEEDWTLCRQLGISAFPSLVFYPTAERFREERSLLILKEFVLARLDPQLNFVKTESAWEEMKENFKSWLLIMSPAGEPSEEDKILAAVLKGLLGVALVNCQSVACENFRDDSSKLLVYMEKVHGVWTTSSLDYDDPHKVLNEVLDLLPQTYELDRESFLEIKDNLKEGQGPWLIHFHIGPNTGSELETKKLIPLLPNFDIGSVHCGKLTAECEELPIVKYPTYVVFKPGGGIEFHHGENIAHSIANFAKKSAEAPNFMAINANFFESEISKGVWFVDFFAPWCPPCMRLLPKLRKASTVFKQEVIKFVTIDCTVHDKLCRARSINSYPSLFLFNSTKTPQKYTGEHTSGEIVEFLLDMINPPVVSLDEETFYTEVGRKPVDSVWMIDFFMPWCGPCQVLGPQFRKVAKAVAGIGNVYLAEVNCEIEADLCKQQGIKSYPHIRLYPTNSDGLKTVAFYSGYQRDYSSLLRWLLGFVPSKVTDLTNANFDLVLRSKNSWIVDFYAPWCGHCVAFEPEFTLLSHKTQKKDLRFGKVNCDQERRLCEQCGVTGYPTVFFYRANSKSYHGTEIQSQSPEVITTYIEQLMTTKLTKDEL